VALALIVRYIDLATLTKDTLTNTLVVATPIVVMAAGTGYAYLLRSRLPAVYTLLGSTNTDEAL
jgi:hypothetical protein